MRQNANKIDSFKPYWVWVISDDLMSGYRLRKILNECVNIVGKVITTVHCILVTEYWQKEMVYLVDCLTLKN